MKSRVFILGAGFSKAAGMPLATELIQPICQRLDLSEMNEWLLQLSESISWLQGNEVDSAAKMNIEEVFHYANSEIEAWKLRQHTEQVGRYDGPGTSWNRVKAISAWLSYLERELVDVIIEMQQRADFRSIDQWSKHLREHDAVLSFNYDTLVEQSIHSLNRNWNHGIEESNARGISIFKLHGSADWIVAHRHHRFDQLDLIFDKPNSNRGSEPTKFVEEDYRLWRCRDFQQNTRWMNERDIQQVADGATPDRVGMPGLGLYKPLHTIPGLGRVWINGMQKMLQADEIIVIGFSMSTFDLFAQLQFGHVAKVKLKKRNPLK
jgi:hypothetical protein